MKTTTRIFLKGNSWYFIGAKFQGSHAHLYTLMMEAKSFGECAA